MTLADCIHAMRSAQTLDELRDAWIAARKSASKADLPEIDKIKECAKSKITLLSQVAESQRRFRQTPDLPGWSSTNADTHKPSGRTVFVHRRIGDFYAVGIVLSCGSFSPMVAAIPTEILAAQEATAQQSRFDEWRDAAISGCKKINSA